MRNFCRPSGLTWPCMQHQYSKVFSLPSSPCLFWKLISYDANTYIQHPTLYVHCATHNPALLCTISLTTSRGPCPSVRMDRYVERLRNGALNALSPSLSFPDAQNECMDGLADGHSLIVRAIAKYITCTGSLSQLRTMLPKGSSQPLPA